MNITRTAPAAPRRPGRRPLQEGPALDRERLLTALLELGRIEGVGALNMRRVAAELGVSTRLLYHFVRDKDEMLDLLADAILERNMPDLSDPDWRGRLRAIATTVRTACAGYPGLPAAILARALDRVDRPCAVTLRRTLFAAFAEAGLPPARAEAAYVNYAALVLGGMILLENARGADLLVARERVQQSLESGLELLLFGIDLAARQPCPPDAART
jgi:TetR/AcrR family tetracycline transcriptional repressor